MALPTAIRGSEWGGSRYSLFQTCHQKHFWSYEYEGTGLVRSGDKYSASRGTVCHLAIQMFYHLTFSDEEFAQLSYQDRVVETIHMAANAVSELELPAEKLPLMRDEVISALDQYFQHYEFDTMEVLEVETPVTIDILGRKYTGVRDMLAIWQGHKMVVDHKTTGLNWDQFTKKWKFDLSLKGYCYERWKATGELHHMLINAIRFTRKKTLEVELEREPIFMTEADMLEFERTIEHINLEIDICRREDFWPKSGHQCVQVYGVCEYRDLCDHPDPAMVKTFYKKRGEQAIEVEANHE